MFFVCQWKQPIIYINVHATVWLGCAPRVSCFRTIEDETQARPVKDTDLL